MEKEISKREEKGRSQQKKLHKGKKSKIGILIRRSPPLFIKALQTTLNILMVIKRNGLESESGLGASLTEPFRDHWSQWHQQR